MTGRGAGISWGGLAAWGAINGLLHIALPRWPQDALAVLGGFALSFTALAAVVVLAAVDSADQPADGRPGRRLAVGSALTAGLLALVQALDPGPGPLAVAFGAGLVTVGSWLGAAIGHRVEHARYLWPLVLVALGADIWSVGAPEGLTRQLVVEGPPSALLDLLVIALPVPGAGVEPVLGVGDVVFTGLVAGVVARHRLPVWRAVLGLAVGFLGTLIALVWAQVPLPALPFLGLAAALALGGHVRPRASELALAVGFVGLMLLGRWLLA